MMQEDDLKDVPYLPCLSFPTIIHCPLNCTFLNYTKAFSGLVVQKIISSIPIFPCKLGYTMGSIFTSSKYLQLLLIQLELYLFQSVQYLWKKAVSCYSFNSHLRSVEIHTITCPDLSLNNMQLQKSRVILYLTI